MPKPSTPEARRARDEIRGLLEAIAMRQAESSASRHRRLASKQPAEPSWQEKEASVHSESAPRGGKAATVCERVVDNREPRDTCDDFNEHHKRRSSDGASRGYDAHRGGRYDSSEDCSPSPEPPGPRVFSKTIRRTQLPIQFHPQRVSPSITGRPNPNFGSPISA
jgi:hypothetical protein